MSRLFKDENEKFRWLKPVPFMLKIATGQELLIVIALALSVLVNFHEGVVGLLF